MRFKSLIKLNHPIDQKERRYRLSLEHCQIIHVFNEKLLKHHLSYSLALASSFILCGTLSTLQMQSSSRDARKNRLNSRFAQKSQTLYNDGREMVRD